MGAVVVDAGVLIGALERADAHHASSVEVFRNAKARGHDVLLPASALSEVLVGAARRGDAEARAMFGRIDRAGVRVVTIDAAVAQDAALLRAKHRSLRLPDALVIASARVCGAEELVTTDRGWPTKRALGFAGKLVVL